MDPDGPGSQGEKQGAPSPPLPRLPPRLRLSREGAPGRGRPAAVTHDQYGENLDGVCRYPKPMKASPLPQVAFKRY